MGRPGFRRILLAVSDSYRSKRAELERAANSLADAVSQAEVFTGARADFDFGVVDAQIKSMTQLFDIKNGGLAALRNSRTPRPLTSSSSVTSRPKKSISLLWPKLLWRKWPAAASTTS